MVDIPSTDASDPAPTEGGESRLAEAGDAAAAPSVPTEVRGLPLVLIQALTGLSLLMLFCGVCLLLFHFRASLSPALRGCLLLGSLIVMWGGYAALPRPTWRNATLACLLLCLSWLVLLLLYHVWVSPLLLWQLGGIFLIGVLLAPLLRPGWPAMALMAVGTLAELGILWYGAGTGGLGVHRLFIWASLSTALALWSLGGFWCGMTSRRAFRPFAFFGPLCYALYLLLYVAATLYPQYLSLPGAEGAMPPSEGGLAVGMWLLPIFLLVLLQRKRARQMGRPLFTRAFLLFAVASLLSLPLGLLLSSETPSLFALPVVALYALCILLYGAEDNDTFLILCGCALFFLTLLSLPAGWGGGVLSGGLALLAAGGLLLYAALHLRRRRAVLLARVELARRRQMKDRELSSSVADPASGRRDDGGESGVRRFPLMRQEEGRRGR